MVAEKLLPSSWAFVQPLAMATLSCAWGPIEGPSRVNDDASVCVCGVWRGLRGDSGALSLSMKEGRPTFGVMAGIWAKF